MINHLKIAAALATSAALALAIVGPSAQTTPSTAAASADGGGALTAEAREPALEAHTLASTAFFDGINVSAIAIGAYR